MINTCVDDRRTKAWQKYGTGVCSPDYLAMLTNATYKITIKIMYGAATPVWKMKSQLLLK